MSQDIRNRPAGLPTFATVPTKAPASTVAPTNTVGPAAASSAPVAAAPLADAFNANAVAPGQAMPEVDRGELMSLASQRFEADPQLSTRLDTLQSLQQRRSELQAELASQNEQLEAYRKEKGGFDSNLRVLAGGKKIAENLLHGNLKFWEGAGEAVTDAETLGEAPQRAPIADLERRIKQLDEATAELASGKPLPSGDRVDFRIHELSTEAASGKKLSPEQLLDGRLARLHKDVAEKNGARGKEHYAACAESFLQLRAANGEGVDALADGKLSLAGRVNQLVRTGVLDLGGTLVTSAQQLTEAKSALADLRKSDLAKKNPEVEKVLAQLPDDALDKESGRLAALEKDPAIAALAPKMQQAHEAAKALAHLDGGLWGFVKGVGHVLDSPETVAMLGAGALTAGKVGGRVLGMAGVRAASVGDLAVMLKAGQLSGRAVGTAAAATAIDGAAFHTLMNGFNIARGKDERATWGAADYARSILLFQVLGGVNANAFSRDIAKTALGRAARGTQRFAEELAGLTTLASADALIQTGNLKGAAHALQENLQFLLAMRMVAGVHALKPNQHAELQRLEKNTAMWTAAAERNPTAENVQRAYEAQRSYETRFRAMTREFAEGGLTSKLQSKFASKLDSVTPEVFAARVEATRSQALEKANSREEKAEIGQRYDGLKESGAFFDPALGRLVIDPSKVGAEQLDFVVRHEGSHLAFQTMEPAARDALVKELTSAPEWAALQKAFVGESPVRAQYSPQRVVDELLADWNATGGVPQGAVAQGFSALMNNGKASARVTQSGLDLRALDAKGLTDAISSKPYNPAQESAEPSPLTIPDLPTGYPAEARFPGAGLFADKLAGLNARVGEGSSKTPEQLYSALFGNLKDPVAMARRLMLGDARTQVNTLGQLDKYKGDSLFIPNRTPEFYLQRLATMPFVSSTREARDVYLAGVDLKNAQSTEAIRSTLKVDADRLPSEAKGVWDAVIVGGGVHGAAAAMKFREANPKRGCSSSTRTPAASSAAPAKPSSATAPRTATRGSPRCPRPARAT